MAVVAVGFLDTIDSDHLFHITVYVHSLCSQLPPFIGLTFELSIVRAPTGAKGKGLSMQANIRTRVYEREQLIDR